VAQVKAAAVKVWDRLVTGATAYSATRSLENVSSLVEWLSFDPGQAIEKAADDLRESELEAVDANPPAGTSSVKFQPAPSRRADALELLAESFLQNGAKPMSGSDKHQIVIHVDAETPSQWTSAWA
jgi:hypothetical protein